MGHTVLQTCAKVAITVSSYDAGPALPAAPSDVGPVQAELVHNEVTGLTVRFQNIT